MCALVLFLVPFLRRGGWGSVQGAEVYLVPAFGLYLAVVFFIWPKPLLIFCQGVFGLLLAALFARSTFLERGEAAWPMLIGSAAAILMYGLAEGFEIAFTKLNSKEADRLLDDRIGTLLADIRAHTHLFYESREWLVILLVIGLTLASDFHALDLPLFGHRTERWATVLFSLLFTTVMVVWAAQSPCKALADKNPVSFLQLCRLIWPPLKFFGRALQATQIFEPGDLIKRFLTWCLPGFHNGPELQPSQEALFHTSLKRYGCALYHLEDVVAIYPDGSARLEQTGLFYVVSGERTQFERWYMFDEEILPGADGKPDVSCVTAAYYVDTFGDVVGEELHEELGRLYRREAWTTATLADDDLGLRVDIRYALKEDGKTEDRKKVSVLIKSPVPLPESTAQPTRAIAIFFEIKLRIGPQGFRMPSAASGNVAVEDRYYRSFSFPCRSCKIRIGFAERTGPTQFANLKREAYLDDMTLTPHPLERRRVEAHLVDKNQEIVFSTQIPLPGVKYQISWDIWP